MRKYNVLYFGLFGGGAVLLVEKMLHHLVWGVLQGAPRNTMAKTIGFLDALQGAQRKAVQHVFRQQYVVYLQIP